MKILEKIEFAITPAKRIQLAMSGRAQADE